EPRSQATLLWPHADAAHLQTRLTRVTLKRDDFSSNRHPTLAPCLSMIFSENRYTLFGIMLWPHVNRSALLEAWDASSHLGYVGAASHRETSTRLWQS